MGRGGGGEQVECGPGPGAQWALRGVDCHPSHCLPPKVALPEHGSLWDTGEEALLMDSSDPGGADTPRSRGWGQERLGPAPWGLRAGVV